MANVSGFPNRIALRRARNMSPPVHLSSRNRRRGRHNRFARRHSSEEASRLRYVHVASQTALPGTTGCTSVPRKCAPLIPQTAQILGHDWPVAFENKPQRPPTPAPNTVLEVLVCQVLLNIQQPRLFFALPRPPSPITEDLLFNNHCSVPRVTHRIAYY